MTQFSLTEAIGSRTNRLVLAGVSLAIAAPILAFIPLDAVVDPAPGREPASVVWLVAGTLLGAIGVAGFVRVVLVLQRIAAAVRVGDDDLVVEGLFGTRHIRVSEITGLTEGPQQGTHSALVVESGSRAMPIHGDEETLQAIADAIGRRNPRVDFGPWARIVRTGRRPADSETDGPAHFIFLRNHRMGLRLQAVGAVVMALTIAVTVVALYDKVADATALGYGSSWKKLIAQTAASLGTLSALVLGLGTSVLSATVAADGTARFARLWRAVEIPAADITDVGEPPRGKEPRLTITHSGGKLTVAGDAAELEGLVDALRRENPGLGPGPWRHLFAERATAAGEQERTASGEDA